MTIRIRTVVGALVIALVAFVGGSAWGANPFTDIGNSGGHMNNIDAIYNAGITAGCSQGPTFYCPNDNVTRQQMASFLARLGGLNSGPITNFPKANGRSDAQVYCTLAAANPASFPAAQCQPSTTLISSGNPLYVSMAIGRDALPIISFYESANPGTLRVAACTTPTCTGPATITTLDDPVGETGWYTSIAIGTDGLPVVAYLDADNGGVEVAKCTTTNCTGTPVLNTVDDSSVSVGIATALAIGPDNLPVIAYSSNGTDGVRVAKCVTPDCSGEATITTVDAANGKGMSIALGADNLPLISYRDANFDLKFIACVAADCTGTPLITTLDVSTIGAFTSATVRPNGFPIMAYHDEITETLRVAACSSPACLGTPVITTVDDDGDVGVHPDIAIATDGLPIISYRDATNQDLKVAKCTTTNCSGTSIIFRVDTNGNVGEFPSIAAALDGTPLVAYRDGFFNDLKVARLPAL